MPFLAYAESGSGWGGVFGPWELHPALNHLPISFLLAAVVLDLYAWWRQTPGLTQVAGGLLIAGVVTGFLSALSGLLAFFTVPAHTEEAHVLMYWHAGIQATALALFAWCAWRRWRNWSSSPTTPFRLLSVLGVALLSVGSAVGGYVVYHGGAGIDPELLSPDVRHNHVHTTNPNMEAPSPATHSHGGDHEE